MLILSTLILKPVHLVLSRAFKVGEPASVHAEPFAPVQVDHGAKGDFCGSCLAKREESRTARHRTRLPCSFAHYLPQPKMVVYKGFANGKVAVAHCIRPKASSIAFEVNTFASATSCRRASTITCFTLAICTKGLLELITKPNRLLISESTVFPQLRGIPKTNNTARTAGVGHCSLLALRIQRKSSTETKTQSKCGKT